MADDRESMAAPRELGERKATVLRIVVEEYVRTGEPVGSETIAERAQLSVSPATIRNELSALEEMGYLGHPHTSAGRVPTDLGYRSFVNSLPAGRLRETQKRAISDFFAQTVMDLEETLVGATQLLSRLTQYAGLAVPPNAADERVVHVELVGVGSVILALIVGQHGHVDKRTLDRPDGIDDGELAELSDRLGRALAGRTATDAEIEVLRMSANAPEPERSLIKGLADALAEMRNGQAGAHVLVRGVSNLAGEAATWRRETIQRLFEALERESEMLSLLQTPPGDPEEDVHVTIGGEHPSTEEWDAAIVSANYRVGDTSLGTIGVVGPTRMDYVTAIATVRAIARRISELATALDG
ncbi:MAG: heat-inducible transcriptional repressor HrcA [Actinomycetota bacterium]